MAPGLESGAVARVHGRSASWRDPGTLATMGQRRGVSSLVFDLWASFYDVPLLQHLAYRPVQDAVVAALDDTAPGRVLDVGCGTGLLTRRLYERVEGTVVGLDYSAGMLARAAARTPGAGWLQGDATRLPLADHSFDVVCCTESFHWYADQEAAASEFARVLAPGGRLLVAHVSPPVAVSLGGRAHWPSPERIARLFRRAGLEIVSQRRVSRPLGGPLLSALLTTARH
jgi:ubiquinone/menaquinone biosynthesis C-methylase UbiE